MSLQEYLKEAKVDQIENDNEFIEMEYELVHDYYYTHGFTDDDLKEFYARGFDDDTLNYLKGNL